jgi:hypothetical protein
MPVINQAYSGIIFVTDIDETIRDNSQNIEIVGVRSVIEVVAARGVPIVYLTAASHIAREQHNIPFLKSFPIGLLMDRPEGDKRPNGEYKADRLASLRVWYPSAKLVCMGDNCTHDAMAYRICEHSFIRLAAQTSGTPIPENTITYVAYNESMKQKVLEVLKEQPPSPTREYSWIPEVLNSLMVGQKNQMSLSVAV